VELAPFDVVMFLGLFGMFIIGYAQGVTRRLLGIGAILFSIGLGAQLRNSLGGYLAGEWASIAPQYSYMIAFFAVFTAAAIALSFMIQISYRPAPLFYRYPVLDEVLGGVLGVIEGFIILIAFLLIVDPYFMGVGGETGPVTGEFGLLRTLSDFVDHSISATVLRENVIPGMLFIFGFLFPKDVIETFATVVRTRV
jgi:uncharacterized membrane protein required for colicin V production